MREVNKNLPRFFIVHVSCTIRGAPYRPGVCYPILESIRDCMEDLVKKELGQVFMDEVRIVTGRILPMRSSKQGAAGGAVSAPSSPSKADKAPNAPVWSPAPNPGKVE